MFLMVPQSRSQHNVTQPHHSVAKPQHNVVQPQHRSSFSNLVHAKQLIGRQVKINRGGPDSVEGMLLAVNGEVLVVESMGVIVYVNGRHVKSITEGTSKGASGGRSGGKSGSGGGRSGHRTGRSRVHPSFITSSSFNSVLSNMRQQFVQINRGGPEKLEGFLADTNNDFILLIVGREFVRIPIFHIKTVNRSGSQSGGSKNNKSSGNKSGGNRSGNDSGSGNRNRSSGSGRNRNRNRNRNRSRSGK